MKSTSKTERTGASSRSRAFLARASLCVTGAAAAGWLAGPASAQTAPASDQSQSQVQEVVVTGSLIKRTDTETPSPVQVISADDIRNSGYTQLSDVLQNLAANGAGSLNQGFGQAFASGGSGIALRGLTVGDTLTLIDGERMVAYPLSDDGERSFVDVTAIPFNVIDSIEVLKDGASAIYGADAIAGVVNVKLKQTYVGSEITAEGGETQHADGQTYHMAAILGWGDLAQDGYNIYMAVDWHRQQLIWGSSRSGTWTQLNWSGYPSGINETPGSPTQGLFAYPDSIQGYVVNPSTLLPNGTYANGLPAEVFLKQGPQPACDSQVAQAAGDCEFSFPGQIQPPTE
jgi:iron complex outermembrane recepter protein